MAKAKTSTVPTIKPNSSLMSWLNQESQTADNSLENESVPKRVVTSEKGDEPAISVGVDTLSNPADEKPERLSTSELVQPEVDEVNKQDNQESEERGSEANPSPPVSKKVKTKSVNGSSSSKSYQERFFKKPTKSEDGVIENDIKPIRISEDSHWLLSVLVQEARRQGNKLTVSDLIENLLTDHREVHKGMVDDLIDQWKARKRI